MPRLQKKNTHTHTANVASLTSQSALNRYYQLSWRLCLHFIRKIPSQVKCNTARSTEIFIYSQANCKPFSIELWSF